MDWPIFHFLNHSLVGHDLLADEVADFTTMSLWIFPVAVVVLWLLGRPGTRSPLRMAAVAAPLAALVGLGVNQVISHIWARARPTVAHPGQAHLFFVPPSGDPSFPSDHVTGAFAIAFAVFFLSRRAGVVLLVLATLVALSRVFVGLHYPSDVGAGLLIGASAAWAVTRFGRPVTGRLVDLIGRISDPIVGPLWRRAARGRAAAQG